MNSQTTSTVQPTVSIQEFSSNINKECKILVELFKKTTDSIEFLLDNYHPGITAVCKTENDFSLVIIAFASYPKLFKRLIQEIDLTFLKRRGPQQINILDICSYFSESFELALNKEEFTEFVCETNNNKTIIHTICDPSTSKNIEERLKSFEMLLNSDKCPQDFVTSHREYFKTVDERFQEIYKKSSKYVRTLTPEEIELKKDIEVLRRMINEQRKTIENLTVIQTKSEKLLTNLDKRLCELKLNA